MSEPTEYELVWLAGFFDGEGCVGVYQRNKVRPGGYRVQLVVTGTHEGSIRRYQEAFGGGISPMRVTRGLGRQPMGRKPMWRWAVVNSAAIAALRQLVPFLYVKREQAEIALGLSVLRQGQRLTAAEQDARREIAERVSALKRSA